MKENELSFVERPNVHWWERWEREFLDPPTLSLIIIIDLDAECVPILYIGKQIIRISSLSLSFSIWNLLFAAHHLLKHK